MQGRQRHWSLTLGRQHGFDEARVRRTARLNTSEGKTMFRFSIVFLLRRTSSFVFAFTAIALSAQTAYIRGTVSDPSGAVIANAQVQLFERGVRVVSVVTDATGQFNIPRSPVPGSR